MHDIYQKKIMEHYHNSPHRGSVENADFFTDATSPSCGDHIVFGGKIENGAICDLKFKGEGSVLGQAVASLLCEYALGKTCESILQYSAQDVIASLGVELGPTRRRTLVFVVETLHKGITDYVASRKTRSRDQENNG